MTSLTRRVTTAASAFFNNTHAAISMNQKWRNYKSSSLTLPTLTTPIRTFQSKTHFRNLQGTDSASIQQSPPTQFLWKIGLPLKSYRLQRRRSSRDSGVALSGDGDAAATAVVEECITGIQNCVGQKPLNVTLASVDQIACKLVLSFRAVRKASLAAWGFLWPWSVMSIITTIMVSCGLRRVDGMCTRGQEYMKPLVKRLKMLAEPVGYWSAVSCFLFLWLSVAFYLHGQIQRWEMSTMALAVSDGAFDPGGSFCHLRWPNTGLGCQLR